LVESNFSLGYANKFYPIYFAPEQVGPPFVLPNNTNLEDISYIFNNDTHYKITSFTYNLVYMKENGCYNMEMRNSNDTSSKVSTFYDKATGILESILIIDGGEFSYLQLKNMTLVDWSVGIGDTIYYSTTIEGKAYEYKTSLLMSGGRLLNMTELEKESDGMIIAVEGQPELQFFKEYYGYLEYWNPEIQKWIRGSSLYPILGGNIYWALAPYMTQVMPPLYLTKGSTGEDLVNNGEGIKKYYDEITYKPDEVFFKNTTNGKCLKFIIDPQTGRILQGTGWMFSMAGGNLTWLFNSFYHRNETTFSSGVNTENFLDVLFPDVTLQYNLKSNSTENFLRTSLLKISPTIMELNESNPLFYCDFAVMHNESIEYLNLTLFFSDSLKLKDISFKLWIWNISGNNNWSLFSMSNNFSYVVNYLENYIEIAFITSPTNETIHYIFAFTYEYLEKPSPPVAIPGPQLILILITSILSLIGLTIISRKKSNII
ncbi:MAG: hypothetical protein ACTSUX_05540, partial [Promethearchaeota archaeon]